MADNETIADIRKETEARFRELVEAYMQRRSAFQTTVGAMQAFNNVFDRIEAAHEREMSKNASKNGGDFGQLGDCAKLREALKRIVAASIVAKNANAPEWILQRMADIFAMATTAIAAPPRNCDRFGGDNAKLPKVYHSECGKECEPQDPNSRQAYLVGYGNWLLALAQKGGAE